MFTHIHQESTAIQNIWLNTNQGILRVQFKYNEYVYTYSIQSNYVNVVKELLQNSSSLGKTVNFIIRSEAVTMVSKEYKKAIVTIQE